MSSIRIGMESLSQVNIYRSKTNQTRINSIFKGKKNKIKAIEIKSVSVTHTEQGKLLFPQLPTLLYSLPPCGFPAQGPCSVEKPNIQINL
jgi:hypothetical protein